VRGDDETAGLGAPVTFFRLGADALHRPGRSSGGGACRVAWDGRAQASAAGDYLRRVAGGENRKTAMILNDQERADGLILANSSG